MIPLLSDEMIERFGVKALPGLDQMMDAVIMAVGHRQFREVRVSEIRGLMNDDPVLVDVKGIVDRGKRKRWGFGMG